eukprot:jgi/Hompol1/2496/HPOL_006018-RA
MSCAAPLPSAQADTPEANQLSEPHMQVDACVHPPAYNSVAGEADSQVVCIGLVPVPSCIDILVGPPRLMEAVKGCIETHWPPGIARQSRSTTLPASFQLAAGCWRDADVDVALAYRLLVLAIVRTVVAAGFKLRGFLNITKNTHRDSLFFAKAPLDHSIQPFRCQGADSQQPIDIIALSLSDPRRLHLIGINDTHANTAISAVREATCSVHRFGRVGSIREHNLDDVYEFTSLAKESNTAVWSGISHAGKVLETHQIIAGTLRSMAMHGFKLFGCCDLTTANAVQFAGTPNARRIQETGVDNWLFESDGYAEHLPAYWPSTSSRPGNRSFNSTDIVSLWVHKTNSLCIVIDSVPSIHQTIAKAIRASWPNGVEQAQKHKSTGIIEFSLRGEPWRPLPGSSNTINARLMLLRIFEDMEADGWRLLSCVNTTKDRLDNVGIFFERSLPVQYPCIVGLALNGTRILRLLGPTSETVQLVRTIDTTLFAMLGSHSLVAESPTSAAWTLPIDAWLPNSTKASATTHRLISRLVEAAENVGFELCAALDLTSKGEECDMLILRRVAIIPANSNDTINSASLS